jgi:FkbM family methyltransferase
LKKTLKSISMACGLYGPLKRLQRRLFDKDDLRQYRSNVAFYAPFISPGDLCFDIGSNIGMKTEVFLKLGAQVVAFEPQPSCLRETAARCSPTQHLTTVNAAIGAVSSTMPMYVAKHHTSSSLIADWVGDVQEVIQVPVMTLDQAIDRYGLPHFCKIDVEGYEMEVLKGLSHAISVLTLEYHLDEREIRKTLECMDYLSCLGELSVNVTLGDEPGFHWSHWIDYDSFQEYFPSRAPRTLTCGWGDLFIRIHPLNAR